VLLGYFIYYFTLFIKHILSKSLYIIKYVVMVIHYAPMTCWWDALTILTSVRLVNITNFLQISIIA